MGQHSLDRVVGEIVPRKERGLSTFLALPGRRPIGARAAERCTAVGIFLDADGDALSGRHAGYLMERLPFLQHVDEGLDASLAGVFVFCRCYAPYNGVSVHSTHGLEESFCFRVAIQRFL